MQYYPKFLVRRKFSNKLLRLLNNLWKLYAQRYLKEHHLVIDKLGSDYGGWCIPVDLISKYSTVYSGGVGEDISFDLQLIERVGCTVHAFDPTPRAIDFVAKVAKDETRFRFSPVGLWSSDTKMRFFAPRDCRHVSHSVVNLQATEEFFEAECKSLSTIMRELGARQIDLLKIDIEGAEYEVISHIIKNRIAVGILCVEFDQPVPFWRTDQALRALRDYGLALVSIDTWNFTFIADEVIGDNIAHPTTVGPLC